MMRSQILVALNLACAESLFVTTDDNKIPFDISDSAWKSFVHVAISNLPRHMDGIKKLNDYYNGEKLEGGMF